MPRRNELLVNDEYYHVYNRSSWNEDLFNSQSRIKRALDLISYYRFHQLLRYSKFKLLSRERRAEYLAIIKKDEPLVNIYAYSLMPDHYHLLLKQLTDGGIKKFITDFQNAYARYFNIKNNNRGSLFINPFKSKRIETDKYFLHVSRYIHLNPVTSYLCKLDELSNDVRSSYRFYVNENNDSFVDTKLILSMVGSGNSYFKFLSDRVDYQRKLRNIKRYLLE